MSLNGRIGMPTLLYSGHDFSTIAPLFPEVRVFEITGRGRDETWNVFFHSCIDECETGASWIDRELATTLRALCELDSRRIPYKVLCRSVFDDDKSSFFLAQYRCLEALYAYSSAVSLAKSFDIRSSWGEIATVLEETLGWHPREEGSLEPHPSPHFAIANAVPKAPAADTASLNFCINGESRCSGMFGIRS